MIEACLEIFFPGPVRSKERVRFVVRGGFGSQYTPKETVAAEKELRHRLIVWKRQVGWKESWNGPVHIRLYVLYPAVPEKGRHGGYDFISQPDFDNIVKTFMDAAQDKTKRRTKKRPPVFIEGIMTDDCRVSSAYIRKIYSDLPTGALLVVEFRKPQFYLKKSKRKPVVPEVSPPTIDSDTVKPLDFILEDDFLDIKDLLGV